MPQEQSVFLSERNVTALFCPRCIVVDVDAGIPFDISRCLAGAVMAPAGRRDDIEETMLEGPASPKNIF